MFLRRGDVVFDYDLNMLTEVLHVIDGELVTIRVKASEITILAGPGSLRSGLTHPFSGVYPMARTPNPNLHAICAERIRRQEASGLTIERFCSQESIARSKFHSWKRRFRLADVAGQCPALPSPSSFLPVTVRLLQHDPAEPPPIEAELPNGVRLRIPTTDPRLACRVIRTVAAAHTNLGGTR